MPVTVFLTILCYCTCNHPKSLINMELVSASSHYHENSVSQVHEGVARSEQRRRSSSSEHRRRSLRVFSARRPPISTIANDLGAVEPEDKHAGVKQPSEEIKQGFRERSS